MQTAGAVGEGLLLDMAAKMQGDRMSKRHQQDESSQHQSQQPPTTVLGYIISWIVFLVNLPTQIIFPWRLQLFELCDLDITPTVIKLCCQETLTAQWTHRLPFIQSRSPADLASLLMQRVMALVPDADSRAYTVIELCSGAGGPTPQIERQMNAARTSRKKRPIQFRLSDIQPNIESWIAHASHSANLSFIPQSVDAASPHVSAISASRMHERQKSSDLASKELVTSGTKTLHLFNLSFHHFSDVKAKQVLRSTLLSSDGFVIIELQDRSLGSLALLSLEWALLFLVTIFWFGGAGYGLGLGEGNGPSWPHLTLTYAWPVLPVVQTWDGIVSCLRTRTWPEMEALVTEVLEEIDADEIDVEADSSHAKLQKGEKAKWTLRHARERHTWPFGYLDAVIGIRKGDA